MKEVFEGSCKLIPVPLISDECIKLVDEFVPELVETLASQMNPQVVCSVAGLCNSPRIDKLLEEMKTKKVVKDTECDGCRTVMKLMRNNFEKSSRDQVLQGMLSVSNAFKTLSISS